MKFFRWFFLSLLFSFLMLAPPSQALTGNPIHVLLKANLPQLEFTITEGEYRLVDGDTGRTLEYLASGETWFLFVDGSGLTLQRRGAGSAAITFDKSMAILAEVGTDLALFKLENNRYRGDLIIYRNDGGLMAVNRLNLEEYLYGVLPGEMGGGFPLEALKAQAVISRTVAAYRLGANAYYDVTATTADQVYGGYEAELTAGKETVQRAVDETRGELIYYDGSLIEAVFHANAGGYTFASQSVWGGARPYLQSVPSAYDAYVLEYPFQSANGWPASSYQWTKSYSLAELQNRIDYWNQNRPNERLAVGQVLNIRPAWEILPDAEGDGLRQRVASLDIIGTEGTVAVAGDKMRLVFDLKSNFFTLEGGSEGLAILGENGKAKQATNTSDLAVVAGQGRSLRMSNGLLFGKGQGKIQAIRNDSSGYTFRGQGLGHGVGLSQWGAIGMAQAGYNYREIIEHYYNQNKFDGRLEIRHQLMRDYVYDRI